ncbi:MAG: tRNA (N6-threonylcarbamoyladenosine(37)-N6)-methyltransferase TrmO [Ruminococcaceae bacterium]|nr:tRNA (N6-threonylcarbamoyladenosine(37)-N6)-methyltransferase TrmO [Oscillospiraceae bacterium]
MQEAHSMKPIAHIHTDFKEKFGIPRQSGRAASLTGRIVFLPAYRNPDALRGLSGFSHIWLLFDFSKSHRSTWSATVRPPRLGGNERVGVFASRSPFRPNPIGLSSVRLLGIEKTENEGDVLLVSGVDLLDMTPIYDIKPYLPFSDCHPDATGGYAEKMQDFHLQVDCSEAFLKQLPEEKRAALLECLAEDPRPAYQDEPERIYSMQFAGFDIHFTVHGDALNVTGIDAVE